MYPKGIIVFLLFINAILQSYGLTYSEFKSSNLEINGKEVFFAMDRGRCICLKDAKEQDNKNKFLKSARTLQKAIISKPPKPKGDSVICSDNKVSTYKTVLSPAGAQANWNLVPAAAGTIVLSNYDSCQITWNNFWRGKAEISVKITNGSEENTSDTLLVINNRLPDLTLGNDTILCTNDSIKLNAGSGFKTYQWQNNSTASIFTVKTGGTYRIKAGNECGFSFDTIQITEIPLPVIHLKDTFLCSNAPIQVDVSLPGSHNYLWQDDSTNPVYIIDHVGQYNLFIEDEHHCKNSKSFAIRNVIVPTLKLPGDTVICEFTSLLLDAYNDGCQYLWQDGSTSPDHIADQTGVYSVKVYNECKTLFGNFHLTIDPLPEINLNDTFMCSHIPIQLNATLPGNYKYLWQDNSTDPVYTANQSTDCTLTITDSINCTNTKNFQITNYYSPYIKLPKDTIFCTGYYITLNPYIGDYDYLWQDGSYYPFYTVDKEGIYSLTVTNPCGTASANISVTPILCNAYVDVPTAFSPNEDGLNDILYAVGTDIKNVQFLIYNRWGQKVFESTSLDNGWDGTYKGKKLETEVFIFYISANTIYDNKLIQKHGNVSLIR